MNPVLKEWITNLTIIAVMAAIADIFLPSGSFKKYTGFIFGIILLIIILQPLLKLMGELQGLERRITGNMLLSDMETIQFQSAILKDQQEELVRKTFKSNLEQHIAAEVERHTGSGKAAVNVTFAVKNGKTDISCIDRVVIRLAENSLVDVRPVEITVGGQNGFIGNLEPEEWEGSKADPEIKEMIADMLKLPMDKIQIIQQ